MRTVTITTVPGWSACVRSPDDSAMLLSHVRVTEGAVQLQGGFVRIPKAIEPVDGVDPAEVIGAAAGNNRPMSINAAAEWNPQTGSWTVLLVDEIIDPLKVRSPAETLFDDALDLQLTGLEIGADRLEARLRLTMPIAGMDEDTATAAVQGRDAVIDPFDNLDTADWRVDIADHDEGREIAWWIVSIEARTPAAVAELDRHLARRTPWKRGGQE